MSKQVEKILQRFQWKSPWLIATTLWVLPVVANEEATHQLNFPTPSRLWFTGPLLAPSGYTAPQGHYSLEALCLF